MEIKRDLPLRHLVFCFVACLFNVALRLAHGYIESFMQRERNLSARHFATVEHISCSIHAALAALLSGNVKGAAGPAAQFHDEDHASLRRRHGVDQSPAEQFTERVAVEFHVFGYIFETWRRASFREKPSARSDRSAIRLNFAS